MRELENAIERAATLCDGNLVQAQDLPPTLLELIPKASKWSRRLPRGCGSARYLSAAQSVRAKGGQQTGRALSTALEPLKDFMREQELPYFNRTMASTGGDKEKAAVVLGISLATLYRKLAGEEPPGEHWERRRRAGESSRFSKFCVHCRLTTLTVAQSCRLCLE